MTEPADLFGPNASQVDMLMLMLDNFPGQKDGIRVPIHPHSRRPWAEDLVARGVRVHPEFMERFPVPGDHPEAGWLNPPRWVPKAEFEEHVASRAPTADAEQQLRQMLQAIDPAAAARIEQMTTAEKRATAQRQAPDVQAIFERMQEYGRQHWEQQQKSPEEG